jgi:predicted N-acetyltransferase YhbS
MQRHREGYRVSTDPQLLDRDAIWAFLRTTYWSPGIAREVVDRGIDNSLVFGLYEESGAQAGFVLGTADAHGLYERFGFQPVDAAQMMERPA